MQKYGDIVYMCKIMRKGSREMRIAHNMESMSIQNQLFRNEKQLTINMRKLSSGLRITNASDDAAGLSAADGLKMRSIVLAQVGRDTQDGISLVQTADGALSGVHSLLQRGRELCVQAANGTLSTEDKKNLQIEMDQIMKGIDDIANSTEFNGVHILNVESSISGYTLNPFDKQSCDFAAETDMILFTSVTSKSLDIQNVDVSNNAKEAIGKFDHAIDYVSIARAYYGGKQERFTYALDKVNDTIMNLATSESNIRDLNVASEMMDFSRNKVVEQANHLLLLQANQNPERVLGLLEM